MTETTALAVPNQAVAEPANPMKLIQGALAAGMSVKDMTDLFNLQERWEKTEAQKRFAEAITGFQRECPQIEKTAGKSHHAYAKYEHIMAVVQPLLTKYEIVVTFNPKQATDGVLILDVRVRVGSYYEDQTFNCPVPKKLAADEPQKMGAALSYAKRYALCAVLNVVTKDEDTDGKMDGEVIDADQITEIELLLRDTKADLGKFLKWCGATEVADIPQAKYAEAVRMLRAKKGGK